MPVMVKFSNTTSTDQQGFIIQDATERNDGVMTKEQVRKLNSLTPGGAMQWNVTATQVGGDTYDANPNDFVPTDANLGNVTVVLPDATTCKGQMVGVKDAAGGNVSPGIKINTVLGQTIDGQSFLGLNQISGGNNFASVIVVSDGANWLILSSYAGTP